MADKLNAQPYPAQGHLYPAELAEDVERFALHKKSNCTLEETASNLDYLGFLFGVIKCDFVDRVFVPRKAVYETIRNNTNEVSKQIRSLKL